MCDKYYRIIGKTGAGVPTIPVSPDHRNGDWLDTDVYEGESYMDTDTGIVYTRNGTDILPIGGGSTSLHKQWKAYVTQTGTNAPVLTVVNNTLGVTVVSAYNVVGGYTLSGFDSNLTGLITVEVSFNQIDSTKTILAVVGGSSVIGLSSYLAGVQTDGILGTLNYVTTITVNKYD